MVTQSGLQRNGIVRGPRPWPWFVVRGPWPWSVAVVRGTCPCPFPNDIAPAHRALLRRCDPTDRGHPLREERMAAIVTYDSTVAARTRAAAQILATPDLLSLY